jgi:subtilisin family serine protease
MSPDAGSRGWQRVSDAGSAASTSLVARLLRLGLLAFGALVLGLAVSTLNAPANGGDDRPAMEHGDDDEHGDDQDREDDEDETSSDGVRLERQPVAARGAPKIRYAPGELLVRFRAGTPSAEKEAVAARAGGRLAGDIPQLGLHVIAVSPARTQEALASLRSEASVASVERDVLLRGLDTVPNDALWSTQWGARLIGAPRAWDSTRGAAGIVIAVVDTGVDGLHPDLVGATVAGRDLLDDDADASDGHGHGTGVAGVIAARTNNHEGHAGICWSCSLMPVRVLDSTGWGKTSTIAAGIVWAAEHGAHVLNMSFGGPATTSALGSAVSYASGKGAVLVAAAGNSGDETPFFPAAHSEVIGVTATDEADVLYSWSNHGDWLQVAAPGCNTATALGGGYVEFCGTSAATPVVAGIAGLALSLNPTASKSSVEQAIEGSATPLAGVAAFGRVNAPSVMSSVSPAGTSSPVEPPVQPPAPPPAAAPPTPPPPPAPPPPPPPPPPALAPPAAPAPLDVTAPLNLQRPRLRGRARVGRTLRVIRGTWSAAPVRFSYRWRRCGRKGVRCRTIRRVQRPSYRLTRRDRGHRLRAVVTAVNARGSATAVSGPSAVVRAARR